jgi:putative glutamine amidotransferase
MSLKDQGFLPQNLLATGIYHEKQLTDFKKIQDFIETNKISWIKFQKISGDLNPDQIFQKNPQTSDFKRIFRESDGIVFFGGPDIPPSIYAKKTGLLTEIRTPFRHYLELSFVFHLFGGNQNKQFKPLLDESPFLPVLGLCLGCQTLNVGTGGTLIQDIWSDVYGKKYVEDVIAMPPDTWHSNPLVRLHPEKRPFPLNLHPIKLMEEGKFVRVFGFKSDETPLVLSSHHQMADMLGKGWKIIATSLDGKVVEAIEHIKFPTALGVQFHPEYLLNILHEKRSEVLKSDQFMDDSFKRLRNTPPSIPFNQKIWIWFSEKMKAYRNLSQR